MSHHVYTFWADRKPLYVGVTGDLPRRMRQHARRPWSQRATFITALPFESAAEAAAAEVERIASLRPAYNRTYNPAHQSVLDAYDAQGFISDHEQALLERTLDRIWPTDADVEKLRAAMAPVAPVTRRRSA